MATAPPPDAENVVIPPTVQINKMSEKLKAAMDKGSVQAARAGESADPLKASETPKPVEKAPEQKPVEKVDSTVVVPDPKLPEVKVAEKAAEKPLEQIKKIPAEQFKILEAARDRFRTEAETAQTKIKELEAKLTEAAGLVQPAEVEALRKDLTLWKGIAERVGLEHTPEFKRAFTDKISSLREEVKEAIGSEQADKVAKLLKMPPEPWRDEQIEVIGEELSGFKQANLIRAYTELKRTERERDAELTKAAENLGKLEEVRTEQERQTHTRRAKQTEDALSVELSKFAIPEFQQIDGNAEHNTAVAENMALVKKLVSADLPAGERAKAAIYAVKGIQSFRSDAIKDALISKLQAQLAEMTAANPGLRGSGQGGGSAATGGTSSDKPLTFAERFKKAQREGVPAKE